MLGDAEGVELLDAPKMEAIGAAEPTQNWMENHGFWGFQWENHQLISVEQFRYVK